VIVGASGFGGGAAERGAAFRAPLSEVDGARRDCHEGLGHDAGAHRHRPVFALGAAFEERLGGAEATDALTPGQSLRLGRYNCGSKTWPRVRPERRSQSAQTFR